MGIESGRRAGVRPWAEGGAVYKCSSWQMGDGGPRLARPLLVSWGNSQREGSQGGYAVGGSMGLARTDPEIILHMDTYFTQILVLQVPAISIGIPPRTLSGTMVNATRTTSSLPRLTQHQPTLYDCPVIRTVQDVLRTYNRHHPRISATVQPVPASLLPPTRESTAQRSLTFRAMLHGLVLLCMTDIVPP